MSRRMRRYSAVAEYDIGNLRPHRYGCRCGDDGRCEQASLAARDEADRRACPTISPDALPPEQQGEQETGTVQSHAVPVSDHQDKGTPAVHAEVPVTGHARPKNGS